MASMHNIRLVPRLRRGAKTMRRFLVTWKGWPYTDRTLILRKSQDVTERFVKGVGVEEHGVNLARNGVSLISSF
jgi:hypothetical protein